MTQRENNNIITQEIIQLYDQIVDRVAVLKEDTQETIASFSKEQEELRKRLKQNLAKGESLRKKDFDQLIGDIVEKRKQREKEIVEMIEQFKQDEEEMAAGLRKLAAKDKDVRIKDLKQLLTNFRKRQEERKEEVQELNKAAQQIKKEANAMLERFRKEREDMAAGWQQLAVTMREKRTGKFE